MDNGLSIYRRFAGVRLYGQAGTLPIWQGAGKDRPDSIIIDVSGTLRRNLMQHLGATSKMGWRILVVEDELLGGLYLCDLLTEMGCEVLGPALSASEALEAISAGRVDLVLMDISLKGPTDGIEAGIAITRNHNIPLIFISAHTDKATCRRALSAGAVGFHPKPFEPEALKAEIARILIGH